MQYWIFPVDGKVWLEVPAPAAAAAHRGERAYLLEASGGIDRVGEILGVSVEDASELRGPVSSLLVRFAPARRRIGRKQAQKILRRHAETVEHFGRPGPALLPTSPARAVRLTGEPASELARAALWSGAPDRRRAKTEEGPQEPWLSHLSSEQSAWLEESVAKLGTWLPKSVRAADQLRAEIEGLRQRLEKSRVERQEAPPAWILHCPEDPRLAVSKAVFESIEPGDLVFWQDGPEETGTRSIGSWGSVRFKSEEARGRIRDRKVGIDRELLTPAIDGATVQAVLAPRRLDADELERLLPDRDPSVESEQWWLLPQDATYRVEISESAFEEVLVGDAICRLSGTGEIDLWGTVLDRQKGSRSAPPHLRVALASLAEPIPAAQLGQRVEELSAGTAVEDDPSTSDTYDPAAIEPLSGAEAERLLAMARADGSRDRSLRFWLLTAEWLEPVEQRALSGMRDGASVLWMSPAGGIASHGTARRPDRKVRVDRRPLAAAERLTAESLERALTPSVREPRRLTPSRKARVYEQIRQVPRTYEHALREELEAIDRLRALRGRRKGIEARSAVLDQAHGARLAGLALSGGGIRSATFNLGVLQQLTRQGLLRGFDYLSTVSGGGYVGGWLVAWLHRRGLVEVSERLPREHADAKGGRAKVSPITWLRRYSNYLTPTRGLFSADTWTAVVSYLANSLLNLLVLVSFLGALLLLPRIYVGLPEWLAGEALPWIHRHVPLLEQPRDWFLVLSFISLFVGILFVLESLGTLTLSARGEAPARSDPDAPEPKGAGTIQRLIVLPLFTSAWALSCYFWQAGSALDWTPAWVPRWALGFVVAHGETWYFWTLGAGVLYLLVWTVLWAGLRVAGSAPNALRRLVLPGAFPAGLGGGYLLWLFGHERHHGIGEEFAQVVVWGPPLVVLGILLTAALHFGMMGRRLPAEQREWWGRLGAWVGIYALAWMALCGIALYGPVVFEWLWRNSAAALGGVSLGWIASTVGGIWAASRSDERAGGGGLWVRLLTSLAPYVFAIGLLVLLAVGVHAIIGEGSAAKHETLHRLLDSHISDTWTDVDAQLLRLLGVFALLMAVSFVLSWRIDVNEFSMHPFYRNRLVRAYLGASNYDRDEHPFTGFDMSDDLMLADVVPSPAGAASVPPEALGLGAVGRSGEYAGPYPILNTALNLTGGGNLAWQQRKARSFFFAPLHYGYAIGRQGGDDSGLDVGRAASSAIRCTSEANEGEGISLGTALTVSGAAVSPNMGHHSSTQLSFLMTVFNARLGLWMGNPKRKTDVWKKAGPDVGLLYILTELFGLTNEDSNYVNLSDGGHFDNLGIYELVRRRCRFIVACDAEGDPRMEFSGLANVIRKCRIDFGVEIEINVEPIRPDPKTGLGLWHCAFGTVRYPEPRAPSGRLLYIKASLTGDEPEDLLSYRERHPGFPHESTGDQWFTESQFESYRRLGRHVARKVFSVAKLHKTREMESLFVDLSQTWYPPSQPVVESFTRQTELLIEIFERLRTEPNLHYLAPQVYAELVDWKRGRPVLGKSATPDAFTGTWRPVGPDELSPEQFREGFFLCNSVIQLMENVYLDLNLEKEWGHPDNRGWVNLFRQWSSSWMFRLSWAISVSTYGARFQTFCERRLKFDRGTVTAVDVGTLKLGGRKETVFESLNELENRQLQKIRQAWRAKDVGGEPPSRVLGLELRLGPRAAADSDLFRFTFGFVVVRRLEKDGPENGLVFLRVRNHLRSLGLGRRALQALVAECDLSKRTLFPKDSLLRKVASRRGARKVEELLVSAWNEEHGAGR